MPRPQTGAVRTGGGETKNPDGTIKPVPGSPITKGFLDAVSSFEGFTVTESGGVYTADLGGKIFTVEAFFSANEIILKTKAPDSSPDALKANIHSGVALKDGAMFQVIMKGLNREDGSHATNGFPEMPMGFVHDYNLWSERDFTAYKALNDADKQKVKTALEAFNIPSNIDWGDASSNINLIASPPLDSAKASAFAAKVNALALQALSDTGTLSAFTLKADASFITTSYGIGGTVTNVPVHFSGSDTLYYQSSNSTSLLGLRGNKFGHIDSDGAVQGPIAAKADPALQAAFIKKVNDAGLEKADASGTKVPFTIAADGSFSALLGVSEVTFRPWYYTDNSTAFYYYTSSGGSPASRSQVGLRGSEFGMINWDGAIQPPAFASKP